MEKKGWKCRGGLAFYSVTDKLLFKSYFYHMAFKDERRVNWTVYSSRFAQALLEEVNRQGAVYKIKCSDCQASSIGETGRNLNTRPTGHKWAARNGDTNNHIAVHHQLTNHNIDWHSAQYLTYSTNYFQRVTLESWYPNLEQTPLNR